MIFRRKAAPTPVNAWEEEGRRLAPIFGSISSAVIVGADAEAAARVAIGLARAAVLERRVAIADLAGESPSLRALAGQDDGVGITDSFRDGTSLNAAARPAADGTPSLFMLPCGGDVPVPEDVFRSERWGRLAAGFAEAGALLLLVAKADSPGLDALVPQADGAVAVGDAMLPLEWRVLAQAGDRTPVVSRETEPARVRRAVRPAGPLRVVGAVLTVAAVVAGATLLWQRWETATRGPRPVAAPAASSEGAVALAVPLAPADTVTVVGPVNPSDSAIAAQFAVELVATNTVAGANSWLRERGDRLSAVTVSPVLLGAGRMRWHKVLAGAWRERMSADSMLAALRNDGVLRAEAGLVVRAPVALLLEAGVLRGAAPAQVAGLVARGVPAYALLQDDGSVRLFAGAFETAAAAVLLSADLRAKGLAPRVAYRTGRTF